MWKRILAVSSVLLLGAGSSGALTIDFEDFVHGEVLAQTRQIMLGVTLTTMNDARDHDMGVVFDTSIDPDEIYTRDLDLLYQGGWASGNLSSSEPPLHDPELSKILIIQRNDYGCDDGICDLPDDEGARPAGSFAFDLDFPEAFNEFSFDLVDVDDVVAERGMVVFTLDGGDEQVYSFEDFGGVTWGDRSANHVELLDLDPYDRVVIHMGGSGGIDNLVMSQVPEPGTAVLMGLGLAGLSIVSRRRA